MATDGCHSTELLAHVEEGLKRLGAAHGPVGHMLVMPAKIAPPSKWPPKRFMEGGPTEKDWYERWQQQQVEAVPRSSWPADRPPSQIMCANRSRGPIHAFWGDVSIAQTCVRYCVEAARRLWPNCNVPLQITDPLDWLIARAYGAAWNAHSVPVSAIVAGKPVAIQQNQARGGLAWSSTPDIVGLVRVHLREILEPPAQPAAKPLKIVPTKTKESTAKAIATTKTGEALETRTGTPPGGTVNSFVEKLGTTLDKMVALEEEPPRGDDWAHNGKLLEMKNACIRALGECYDLSGKLPDALASVWTPTVAQEIADLRTSLDSLRKRMRGSSMNGFNHPILRVSDAPQHWKDDWDKHEGFLWHMMSRLRALDVGSPQPPTEQKTVMQAAAVPFPQAQPADAAAMPGTGYAYPTTCAEEAKKRGNGCDAPQIARERGEDYIRNHPYPGLKELARRCKCHHSVMRNAIADSRRLQRAKAQYDLQRAKPAGNAKPTCDPSWQAQVDEALRVLIENASESQRAKFHTPEMRQQLEVMEPAELAALVADAQRKGK